LFQRESSRTKRSIPASVSSESESNVTASSEGYTKSVRAGSQRSGMASGKLWMSMEPGAMEAAWMPVFIVVVWGWCWGFGAFWVSREQSTQTMTCLAQHNPARHNTEVKQTNLWTSAGSRPAPSRSGWGVRAAGPSWSRGPQLRAGRWGSSTCRHQNRVKPQVETGW
jgi:hypothetical protein